MKKKILFRTIIFLIIISAMIGSHQMAYADYSKLYLGLYEKVESMTDEECEDVKVCFYRALDIEEVQKRAKDLDTYEERYVVIRLMYDEIITSFIHKYYVDDMSKVHEVDYNGPAVTVEATKEQILQFTEEKTVQFICPDLMQGADGTGSLYLLETKAAAMANILGYVSPSDYRIEQQKEIQTIIVETLENINQANTENHIQEIVSASQSRLDAVKTDEQLKAEEQPEITQPEDSEFEGDSSESEPKPTAVPSESEPGSTDAPSDSESGPTDAPSESEPKPTVTPSDWNPNLTVAPSKSKPKSTITPSKFKEPSTAAPQEKESTDIPPATPSEIYNKPPVTPQEKVSLSTGATEAEPIATEKPESDRTLAKFSLIAFTAIILTIIWFITKKRRLP